MRDRRLIYAAAFLRSCGVGLAGAVLGVYLDKRGYGAAAIGGVVAAGLAGGAVATGLASVYADRWGRRRTLWLLAALGALGGLALIHPSIPAAVLGAVFLGMVNGMGHDRGAAYVLEQAALSGGASVAERTRALAWYHAIGAAGAAAGSLSAAAAPRVGYPLLWSGYAAAMGAGVLLYPGLSSAVELSAPQPKVSERSRGRILRFAGLSCLDSLGSGFLTGALLAFYFYKRFGLLEGQIAGLFLAANIANILSNFGAERIARRIGLVNTMVFTHLPANLLLMVLPLCPSFKIAAAVFLLRELFVEMDVPTRQSYLASIVSPEERVAALGTVQLTRTAMWAVTPAAAGWMMGLGASASPLVVGSSIKIVYDLLMWRTFRHLAPSEAGHGSG